jgi:predicted RecB family nuclease
MANFAYETRVVWLLSLWYNRFRMMKSNFQSFTSITTELFSDFLNCRYKAFLKAADTSGTISEFQKVEMALQKEYAKQAQQNLQTSLHADQVLHSPKSLARAIACEHLIITNAHADVDNLSIDIDAIVRVKSKFSHEYIPILYVHNEQLVKHDKLLLAFWGVGLARVQNCESRIGKIIHGNGFTSTKVHIDTLIPSVEHDLLDITSFAKGKTEPQFRLNGHCSICEFQQHCRDIAFKKDDLSLLRTLKEKEITKLNAKGIFTTTQLSYTYRPRKRHKKAKKQTTKHHHSLQALALRTDTIYIAQKPQLQQKTRRVYLDIEGVPDRNFYYLIGLHIIDATHHHDFSFWADCQQEERIIWESLLAVIKNLDSFVLFHYGSYDAKAIGHLYKKYGGNETLVNRLIASCANVLSFIYGHIYFPTYSNGLKSIASCLGFKWSDTDASGIQSLVWRYRWKKTHNNKYKKQLLTYNQEDCLALKVVSDAISVICNNDEHPPQLLCKETIDTATLVRGWPNVYKRNDFYFPALERINRCAYFDYQRERVYVRTSDLVKKSVQRKKRIPRIGRLNQIIELGRPSHCPHCGTIKLFKHGAVSKIVHDLKLFKGGIKRWMAKYMAQRYLCTKCGRTFFPEEYPSSKWGDKLQAWAVYQNIGLLRSHGSIMEEMCELFSYEYPLHVANRSKILLAAYYEPTYHQLIDRIQTGQLIHADETKVSVQGKNAYVWVFTNLEEVAYIYSDTREGTVVGELLKNFRGVLISDFYTAYDSLDCVQQKCLIHLIRDINDDLFKNPFDEDLKALAADFTDLLVPIIETVDRYGLKKRHLNKHCGTVQRFFAGVSGKHYSSEIAQGYQRRFGKYKEKLFVFLEHDGVPWNNNNAENAVKRFVFLRRVIGGSSTEEGIKEYLKLLSIRETLRRKNISFLEFLLAKQPDLSIFLRGR